jgi:heavy metal sensor kinase
MRIPLRVRLTLAFAVGMAIVLSGFGAFVYLRLGRDLLASVDLGLRARVEVMAGVVQREGAGSIVSAGRLIDPDESIAQIIDANGSVLQASSATSEAALLSARELGTVQEPTFLVRTVPEIDSDPLRLLAVPVTSSRDRYFLVAGATLGDRRDALDRLLVSLAIGGPVVLIVMSAFGWMMVGGALRPVERMRREADAVSASEPDRRLPVPGTGDELARLGTTLNAMLDRLQQALEREHRFVDDASHELRTPLSVLKMELDLALARARTPEELAQALRAASDETDRLVRLAEDLLVLARTERHRVPVQRKQLSIHDLVAGAVSRYAERAGRAGARMEVDLHPGTASVDPVRVGQALENLLDNAVRHTPPGGVITLRAARAGNTVRIEVEDSGPGFPLDLLHRVFEPFARSETDGSGNGSGAGLGLAIVRAVGEAHEGTATAENLAGGGARVTLLLRT